LAWDDALSAAELPVVSLPEACSPGVFPSEPGVFWFEELESGVVALIPEFREFSN
jgi:hypothetical protein